MHNNFYFLRQLAPKIKEKILGLKLMVAWSQEKDELVLGFAAARGKIKNFKEFYIKVVLFPDFSCLHFTNQFERARKNSVELFTEITDLEVIDVEQFENERAFAIHFEQNFSLVLKLFGNRSNVILFKEDEVIDIFHNKLVADNQLKLSQIHRPIDQSHSAFEAAQRDHRKLFPTLGKVINNEFKGKLSDWEGLSELVSKIKQPTFYLSVYDHEPHLLLLPLGEVKQEFSDPIEAINAFYVAHAKVNTIDKEKAEVLRKLNKEKRQTDLYLQETYQRLEVIENQARHEEVGHILMANLHLVPTRAEQVEVFDFYRNKNIVIKLKADLTPQKNAENFYRKAKNEKIEVDKIVENIEHREHVLATLNEHITAIEEAETLKVLRAYIKLKKLAETKGNAQQRDPFKLFRYEQMDGFDIFIGRNAKNNDMLTQQFSFKEDLWFHARDAQGSHVLLKHRAGKSFPSNVVERAAALAAWHSKRRNETVAPVIMTKKKFVRKPKGLPEGMVVLDREEVVMIKPEA